MTMATQNLQDAADDAAFGQGVRVACTARLHLGFLDLDGSLGRRFGSIGLALDAPATCLTLRRAPITTVVGDDAERAGTYLARLVEALRLPAGHELVITQAVPAHAGLGSGTQLALSVGTAARRLHGLGADAHADAALLDRGRRSGVGIGLFQYGGLVVDGGKGVRTQSPPVVAHVPVPEAWRVLLLLDRSMEGLSGQREVAAFASLPPMAPSASAEICRLVLMQALPAIVEADLGPFGSAITRIQEIAGDYFAPAQNGRFVSRRVAATLSALQRDGATGVGQSSWGPTGFAFVRDAAEADRLVSRLRDYPEAKMLDIMICRGLNQPASVSAA